MGQEQLRNLAKEHAITRGAVVQVVALLHRGFWGRMKWLLLGR